MLSMMDANFEAEPARGFGYGEHLLVWSWRWIAAGLGDCPLIAREFADICGEDVAEVVATLDTFLRALTFAGRRAVVFGPPGSLAVTADERQILWEVGINQDVSFRSVDEIYREVSRADVVKIAVDVQWPLRPQHIAHDGDFIGAGCRCGNTQQRKQSPANTSPGLVHAFTLAQYTSRSPRAHYRIA